MLEEARVGIKPWTISDVWGSSVWLNRLWNNILQHKATTDMLQ